MSYYILSVCRYKLIFYSKGIFSICSLSELIFRNSNCRLARIISRIVCYFRCNGVSGCSYCIAVFEILFCKFIDLTSYFYPVAAIHVIIVNCEFIVVDLFFFFFCICSFINYIILIYDYLRIRSLYCPVIKYFTFHKRRVREISNLASNSNICKVL